MPPPSPCRPLQELVLAGNQHTGFLPASWSALTGLVTLDLYGNKLEGLVPSGWPSGLSTGTMTRLTLSGNAGGGAQECSHWSRSVFALLH